MSRSRRKILGVSIDDVTLVEATALAEEMLTQPTFHHVVTPGPEFLLEASANQKFEQVLNRADLSLPDGMGLKVAGLLTGQSFRSRVTGVDFTEAVLKICHRHGYRLFLFGGQTDVVQKTAEHIARRFPHIAIVGIESGYRGSWQKLHDQQVVEKIHLARPHVLLVALGAPKQELWIDRHRVALHDVRLAMGVGRTFDYLAGHVRRPPKLIRQLGLEWLTTYIMAGQFHQPGFRRRRVRNATWRFMLEIIKRPHG